MLLEVEHLTTEFATRCGPVRAIRDVSFSIEKGEILALVGESGSGKSVTSLSIMRLLSSNGTILPGSSIKFNGTDLMTLSEKQMRQIRGNRISMIFQEPMTSLNPIFTVGDQILESIKLHTKLNKKEAKEKLLHLLDTVGIPNPVKRINDYPHQMSGGMRQRIMIAMAMACEPELLIADEPYVRQELQLQHHVVTLPGQAALGKAGSLAGGGGEVGVAPAALAAPAEDIGRAVGHVLDDLIGLRVPDQGTPGHPDDQGFAVLAGLALAGAVHAVLGGILALVAEIHQGGEVVVHLQNNVAAVAAVAAVRAAGGNVFLPVEGHAAVAAVSCLHGDPGLVYKGCCHGTHLQICKIYGLRG